jgi:predicted RNase H-like HicB family nuclease
MGLARSAQGLGKMEIATLNTLYPMSYRLTAVIEKDSDGYYVYCPELKGCQSQGDTFEEAQANIQEAIELYVETLSDIERQQPFRARW